MSKLNAKQETFCREYLIDLNAMAAAQRAGYTTKNKRAGYELMKIQAVADRIAELMAARAERAEVDADWVLRRLVEEATADMADLVEPDGSVKSIHDWPEIWRKGLVAGVDVTDLGGIRTTKVKLSDRIKRLELIGRHVGVGAFKDRIEHGGPNGGPIEHKVITPQMPQEEATRIYRENLKRPRR